MEVRGRDGGHGQQSLLAESPNLRDFLRLGDNTPRGVTLGEVLGRKAVLVNRTLLDIIQDDPSVPPHHGNRKTWRTFKDKIRLTRSRATDRVSPRIIGNISGTLRDRTTRTCPRPPLTSNQIPESTHTVRLSSLLQLELDSPTLPSTSYPQRTEFSSPSSAAQNPSQLTDLNEEREPEPQVRMSLSSLLAETDRPMGLNNSVPFVTDNDVADEEDEEVSSVVGEHNSCCVCMTRHKGSALIPCGHTFCRLCSRELWVQRGTCPLCNNFILEILDIF